jgi:hypothetical protein
MALARSRIVAILVVVVSALVLSVGDAAARDYPKSWVNEWPRTDFNASTIPLSEIRSVVRKDGIPAIGKPRVISVGEADHLGAREPVIGVVVAGEARAYPLQLLIWHEIVNDTLGGIPIAVTFCPLCNASVVYDRRIQGKTLTFGVTGKLRYSDLVMYDRETESWWQQFTGEGIVGELSGEVLKALPARIESFAQFRARAPDGTVVVPKYSGSRQYGSNPYVGYDTSRKPFLYDGPRTVGIAPLARLVTVDKEAWTLGLVRKKGSIETSDGLVITWIQGQNSALDSRKISSGRDVGSVIVQKKTSDGLIDVPYGVDFAFAFKAFYPDAIIHHR